MARFRIILTSGQTKYVVSYAFTKNFNYGSFVLNLTKWFQKNKAIIISTVLFLFNIRAKEAFAAAMRRFQVG